MIFDDNLIEVDSHFLNVRAKHLAFATTLYGLRESISSHGQRCPSGDGFALIVPNRAATLGTELWQDFTF